MTRDEFDKLFGIRTDGQIHGSALNPDGMTEEELQIAATHPALHSDVRSYAHGLRAARRYRLRGAIHTALVIEAALERTYRNIPDYLQW